jgi:hypothetical protein
MRFSWAWAKHSPAVDSETPTVSRTMTIVFMLAVLDGSGSL